MGLPERKHKEEDQKRYLDFIRNLLKDKSYAALAYMTGILPVKKYGTHSALNMFDEYSMTDPHQFANTIDSQTIKFSFLHNTYCPLMQYGLCRNLKILAIVSIAFNKPNEKVPAIHLLSKIHWIDFHSFFL